MRAKNAIIMKAVQIKDKIFFDKPRHVWRHASCRGFLFFIKTVNEYIQKLHDRICYI